MSLPIIPRRINGHTCVLGPADMIRAAIDGATQLTITDGHAAGERVWLAPLVRTTWRDGMAVDRESIADTLQHPEHGEILAAYVDMTRLDDAPVIAEIERKYNARTYTAARDAENRGRAMVPPCDNCGDCPQCC